MSQTTTLPSPMSLCAFWATQQQWSPLVQRFSTSILRLAGPMVASKKAAMASLPRCPSPVGSMPDTPTGSCTTASSVYRASQASRLPSIAYWMDFLLAATARCSCLVMLYPSLETRYWDRARVLLLHQIPFDFVAKRRAPNGALLGMRHDISAPIAWCERPQVASMVVVHTECQVFFHFFFTFWVFCF